jgi:hypothetical protein
MSDFQKFLLLDAFFVNIFPLKDVSICPVQCLKSPRNEGVAKNYLVFKFSSRKFLTPAQINKSLKEVLSLVLEPEENKNTSHSSRAAIPSFVGKPGRVDVVGSLGYYCLHVIC